MMMCVGMTDETADDFYFFRMTRIYACYSYLRGGRDSSDH